MNVAFPVDIADVVVNAVADDVASADMVATVVTIG